MRSATTAVLLLVLTATVSADPPAATEVPHWGRFEGAVTNRTAYRDHFRDVTLEVVFTRPDGSRIDFRGFYDGDHTWRFRTMADQIGRWRYRVTFSDGQPGTNGSFRCVRSDLPGMISVDRDNPMWFGYSSGRHELIRGLHVGDRFFAANWPDAKRTAFLDWLVRNRYNMLSIASHYLNRDDEGRGRGWSTPELWPLDPPEYDRMEVILDELARRRILVFPFGGFFGKASDYPRDPADQEVYIRYTLARLAPYWNLMFNVAGPEPNLGSKTYLQAQKVERLGRLIKQMDPFGHLISVHNREGDDPYRDSDWSSYGVLQGPKTRNRQVLSRGLLRSHHARKPLLAQETLWSGNRFHIRRNQGDYTDDDLRKNTIVIHMSAAGLVFGDNDGNSSSGFTGTMDLADCKQARHDVVIRVWDFFETIACYRMRPSQDLVDNGYCLADEGAEYLVYLESGGKVNVAVRPGTYSVQWINARSPRDVRKAGTTSDGRALCSPSQGEDWFVRLMRSRARKQAPSSAGVQKIGEGTYPDLAVDRQGHVHVVYARGRQLLYRKLDVHNNTWTDEQDPGVPATNPERSDPEVVVDSNGRPHVFCGQTYAWHDGDTWRQLTPGVGRDSAMAIDSRNNVYLVRRGGHHGGLVGLLVRKAGGEAFQPLPDPDTANGLPKGKGSNHVYGHIVVSPVDDSLHVVYRHGAPVEVCYRTSTDAGRTWAGCGISKDRAEAPSAAAGPDGSIYLITGRGLVFRRDAQAPLTWKQLGQGITAKPRDLPALAVDSNGALFVGCFGGHYNIFADGRWLGQRRLPRRTTAGPATCIPALPTTVRTAAAGTAATQAGAVDPDGTPLGFVELAATPRGGCWVVWEQGQAVDKEERAGTSDILFARIRSYGTIAGR